MEPVAAQPAFRRYVPGDDDAALIALLTSNHWPFHVNQHPSEADARAQLAEGAYSPASTRMWWIDVEGETAGFVRAMDIGDGDPTVDIRLAEAWRGRGLGRLAVQHLVGQVFAEFRDVHRIEAQARRDNVASRRTLRACGFVKEAVYRLAYAPYVAAAPAVGGSAPKTGAEAGRQAGSHLDSIGYALLRRDWESGTSTPVDFDEEP